MEAHYWIGRNRLGALYVERTGDASVFAETIRKIEGEPVWERAFAEKIRTREQMLASPELTEALSRWESGDRSIQAEEIAESELFSVGSHLDCIGKRLEDDERDLLSRNRDIEACRDILRVDELLQELETITERYDYAYDLSWLTGEEN